MKNLSFIFILLLAVSCNNGKETKGENTDVITDSITEYLTDTVCCNQAKEDCTVTKSNCCISDSTAIEKTK